MYSLQRANGLLLAPWAPGARGAGAIYFAPRAPRPAPLTLLLLSNPLSSRPCLFLPHSALSSTPLPSESLQSALHVPTMFFLTAHILKSHIARFI